MVKKRRRLKPWVKVSLFILAMLAVTFTSYKFIEYVADDYNNFYKQCDEAKGHTCSYYEARQYAIRGE